MLVLDDTRLEDGWITAFIGGFWCQAKVYDEGSSFGINNGRISKLVVCDDVKWNHDKLLFSYDRGDDVNNMTEKDLKFILMQLEALPKVFNKEN
jgi:hypothetical protein